MKLIAAIVAIVVLAAAVIGCSSRLQENVMIIGVVKEQNIHNGFVYDVAEYKLTMDDGTEFSIKVREGWLLPVGQRFVFRLKHAENDEYRLVSVELIDKVGYR